MTVKITVAALCVAVVLVAVVVAEEAGWQESAQAAAGGVKGKVDDAVEGAKSWTDWAVGKLSDSVQFHDDEKKEEGIHAKEKLGEAKEKVIKMASDTQEKANEAYESAKGSVSEHAKSGYDAAKEKTAQGAEKAGLPGHNEL